LKKLFFFYIFCLKIKLLQYTLKVFFYHLHFLLCVMKLKSNYSFRANLKIKVWLYLPSKWIYFLSPIFLKIYSFVFSTKNTVCWHAFCWRNIDFSNPLGIAGGVDKNAFHLKDWTRLGVGFLEIGTVTPLSQKANHGKILDRSLKHLSVWNNMGFPNKGIDVVKKRLQKSVPQKSVPQKSVPLFINIGKNRSTPLSQAVEDYKKLIESFYPFASAFVINISSPNTEALRDLFDEKNLLAFLKSLKEFSQKLPSSPPLILKLSPDEENHIRILKQSIEAGIDGWCICNSTKSRSVSNLFPKTGGVSGALLADKSIYILKKVKKYLVENEIQDKLLISCGGVLTAQDVRDRLKAGAHLVQVYSALVFEGPGFFKSVLRKLSQQSNQRAVV